MIKIRQSFLSCPLQNIAGEVEAELLRMEIAGKIPGAGKTAAVCVGSRGIANLRQIVKSTIDFLQTRGCVPYIVPAMGSHGNASAVGQTEILASYGITEKSMGVPVRAGIDVAYLGETEHGVPVYTDRQAICADAIIPINRVKVHTDFKGEIESGVCKMLCVGLGNEKGASTLHSFGAARNFAWIIPEVADFLLKRIPVNFGLGIVEDGYDQTAKIRALPAETLIQEEKELMKLSRTFLPRIGIPRFDILIVEEFGKDISGSGMDPNITGRTSSGDNEGFYGPDYQFCIVLDLTEASHGNGIALNAADFVTRKVVDKLDLQATYRNCLACHNPRAAQIPMIARDEAEAVAMAVQACKNLNGREAKIVKIKNTLEISELWITENLVDTAEKIPGIEILE